MALLDGILGGGLLGGGSDSVQQSSNSSESNDVIASSPALGLSLDNLLHSSNTDSGGFGGGEDSSDFTGLGGLDLGLQAPTLIGLSSSNDSSNTSATDGHNGGLLGGLL